MTKVYVGMSGGVDSSLTASLMLEQGYDVTGVYMKNWSQNLPGMECPWADDLADAKRVAVQLGIDFKVFDFEHEYRERVVQYMIDEYKAGRTPNPDIMCNQEVKCKLFVDASLADGADKIATGHYARIRPSDKGNLMCLAEDSVKDQTYFLYRVTKEALNRTLFPLGDVTKTTVRKMSRARGLYTAAKRDSQGICFVGQVGIKDFLRQYVTTQPGDIVDKVTGKKLGRHDGAIFYTIGQRHGLDVGGGLPYYVVGKDMAQNIVYVTTNLNDETLWLHDIKLGLPHWIYEAPRAGSEYLIRVRHRAPLIKASVKIINKDELVLSLTEPQRAVTPGQSVVIYDNDVVLGGGVVL